MKISFWIELIKKRRFEPSFLNLDLKQTNFNGIPTSNDVNKMYYHNTI